MTAIGCEQLRYTWAERRLDGSGADFGVVLRSPGWPAALLEDPGLRELLTGMSLQARRLPPDAAPTLLSHRRVSGGALLVAKAPVGTDGAGRPGNYAVHALFDPTATLGALDLRLLLDDGVFRLERAVDATPDPAAPVVEVSPVRTWPRPGPPAGRRPAVALGLPAPGAVLRAGSADRLAEVLLERCCALPADLVNAFDVAEELPSPEAGAAGRGGPAAEPDDGPAAPPVFAAAAALGARDEPFWWRRRGRDAAAWTAEVERWWLARAPVHRLPDDQLWRRWDVAEAAGREEVAGELLNRPALVAQDGAASELATRPALVDDLTEAGVRAGGEQATTAAHWVAAAGSDDQVVDLAAELASTRGRSAPPEVLLARLVERHPDELPPLLAEVVADALLEERLAESPDGAGDRTDAWRVVAARRLLQRPDGAGTAVAVVARCGDEQLADALVGALAGGTRLADCWDRLGAAVPPARRATVFAAGSPATAGYLLDRGVGSGPRGLAALSRLWPVLAGTTGWASSVRDVFAVVAARERALRVQRTLLLALVGVLVVTVVVLAVLLAQPPG